MDRPRTTSTPAIHGPDFSANHASQHASRRNYSHAPSKPFSKTASMSIPNSRDVSSIPPPPLPPPRFIKDIDSNHDPGWRWGNSGGRSGFGSIGTGTVSPASSLRRNWDRQEDPEAFNERRRDSSASVLPSPTDMHDTRFQDEGYHSLSGSSNLLPHQLHLKLQGERPLEQRTLNDSSKAYDNVLLSKIGRPNTPPRGSTSGSVDASPTARGPFHQSTKHPHQLKQLTLTDRSLSTSSDPPFKSGTPFASRWMESPRASVVSPGLISSAANAKNFMEHRNSGYDNSIGPFSASSRMDGFTRMRQARRADSDGSILVGGFDDSHSSVSNRVKRVGSYDQSVFTSEPDLDSDFPIEETGGMRQLHLDDQTPPSIDVHSPDSRLGMKRRASSPLREAQHEDKAQQQHSVGNASDLYQRRTSGHLATSRASPTNRYHPPHGSVSSTSSGGLQNGSYASSTGLSVGGSSYTSVGSNDRLSPAGISPLSEYHDTREPPYVSSNSLDQSPRNSISRAPHQRIPPDLKATAALARKMSLDNATRVKQQAPNKPQLQSNLHICDCCPKKPKKFDTAEELHNHQLEKQYTCQWCHNRFKNKNEAERHQNSLHLRRHSWSCATIANNYVATFHHCTAIPPNTNVNHPPPPPSGLPGQHDICGYCGQEFPNDPAPDWEARIHHLTSVHKFGECNQSKKFFRADHFRQHLKHSHAGTSGKWTNMLEAACMKDEPPLTPEAQSQEHARLQQQQQQQQQQQGAPVANMMGGGPASRQGPQGSYGGMGMALPNPYELQNQKIEEEIPEEM